MITKKLGAGVGEVSFALSNKQNLISNLYLTVQCFNDKSWDLIMIISRTHRLGLYRKGPTGEGQYFSETHTQDVRRPHEGASSYTAHVPKRDDVRRHPFMAEDERWAERRPHHGSRWFSEAQILC